MTPSKPLTPTELDEVRQTHWHSRAGVGPHEAYACGLGTRPCFVARLLATLDATQAVEPGLDDAARALVHALETGVDEDAAEARQRLLVAARSSSAPAELAELDAAWKEAEEALPVGTLLLSRWELGTYRAVWTGEGGSPRGSVDGSTPAAALRALAARLTSSPENPA